MSVLSRSELIERIYCKDVQDPKRIFIVPSPQREEIGEASIDLCLGNRFIVTKSAKFDSLRAWEKTTPTELASYQEKVLIPFDHHLVVHPGSLILGVSWQYIGLPKDVQAQVVSRSTWGRAGLTVATAFVVHPGFVGCLTLELVNSGNAPIALRPGTRLAQMIFMHVTGVSAADTTSMSRYFGMTEPGFSRLYDECDELDRWKKIGEHVSFQSTD